MVHLNTSIGRPPEHDEVDPAFGEVWARNLPAIRERIWALERAAEAARCNQPIEEEARDAAHKLAGSLGSFGLARGSDLARELEKRLGPEGDPDRREIARLVAELRSVIEL